MTTDALDPAGPILATLFAANSSDLVVDVVNGAGIRVDWSLNDRQNYSHRTRIREYRPRVNAALNALAPLERAEALTGVLRGLVERGRADVDSLNSTLRPTGWCINDGRLVKAGVDFSGPDTGPPMRPPQLLTAVVVTALELEAAAVKAHLEDVTEEVHPKGTVYFSGRFCGDHDAWRIVIVVAGAGNPTAAIEVERAVSRFTPQIVLFVGVAGGIKDVDVGDVVAADKIHSYERGKAEADFLPRPDGFRCTYGMVQRARAEVMKAHWQNRILGPRSATAPKALVAPIAAGEKVVAARDSPAYQFLRHSYSDAVALEMEGAGFLAAAHANRGVDALVVRGISDLIEGKAAADAEGGQPLAARHAAAFAFQVLSTLSTEGMTRSPRRGDHHAERLGGLARELVQPVDRDPQRGGDAQDGHSTGATAQTAALASLETALRAATSTLAPSSLPRELVDAEVERRLALLRKTRFLMGAAPAERASRLAQALLTGELHLASSVCKARALAWCGRLLFDGPDLGAARAIVRAASILAGPTEVLVAEAFERFHDGDLPDALGRLSLLDSPMARAAAFIMVRKAAGPTDALSWLEQSGLGPANVDSDGKFFVMAAQLDTGQIADAQRGAAALSREDFQQTPALLYVAANVALASVAPAELASSVLSQPAATLLSLPLADGVTALDTRRDAMRLFRLASESANALGCPHAASEASDRALVLALSDPQSKAGALAELEANMRSPEHALRRLPLALDAGLKVDIEAAEKEVERHTTLTPDGT